MVLLDPGRIGLDVFLERYGDTRAKQEVLLFWALHPNARFSRLAVLSAVECSRLEAERALTCMVKNELLNMHSDSGSTIYSLNQSENIRQMLAQLGALDWGQRQIMFSHARHMQGTCNLVPGQEGI